MAHEMPEAILSSIPEGGASVPASRRYKGSRYSEMNLRAQRLGPRYPKDTCSRSVRNGRPF